jgi:DNA-binding beta-propeller fold protein YncE
MNMSVHEAANGTSLCRGGVYPRTDRIMKNLGRVIRIAIIMLAVAAFLGPGGCAKSVDQVRKPLPDILWPGPPEKPRIQFVDAVSKPEDIQIKPGLFKRFFRYLIGKEETSMVAPYGVETDVSGRLYVADTFLRTVHVFDVRKNAYYLFPADKAKFVSPIDIAVDHARGKIYVSDSKQGMVKVFEKAGKKFVGEIGKGILQRPTGITVNEKTSELLVVDTRSGHIFRYDLTDHRLKGKFGGSGTADGKLNYPTNICVAEDGIILVSDSLNFRVQTFSPEGRFLGKFGSIGDSPGYFSRPRGVAADSDGNIYVVDGLFDNVQIFDKEFRLLMAFGEPGHGYGEFWLPSGIYIDKDDLIYVSDSHNKRVQIFQYLKGDASLKK